MGNHTFISLTCPVCRYILFDMNIQEGSIYSLSDKITLDDIKKIAIDHFRSCNSTDYLYLRVVNG